MSEPRIKAGIWVSMALRMGNAGGRFGAVLRKGDADAGGVLVVLRRDKEIAVLSQVRSGEGDLVWMRATGPAPVPRIQAPTPVAVRICDSTDSPSRPRSTTSTPPASGSPRRSTAP